MTLGPVLESPAPDASLKSEASYSLATEKGNAVPDATSECVETPPEDRAVS
jgi:hypothetical protein